MVLLLALAQAVNLRCLLSIDHQLEDSSNPASSRKAFLTVLAHTDPGLCDILGSWVDWAMASSFFGAFLPPPFLHPLSWPLSTPSAIPVVCTRWIFSVLVISPYSSYQSFLGN